MSDFYELRWNSSVSGLYARDYPSRGGSACLPVVCLHGLTRNSADFDDIALKISNSGRRVIVPDIRGRGKSGRGFDPASYSPAIYADDILRLLDSLGIKQAIFIGTSMGGVITMLLAVKRLGAIAAAILNEAGPEVTSVGIDRISSYVPFPEGLKDWGEATKAIQDRYAVSYPFWTDTQWSDFAKKSLTRESDELVGNYDPDIWQTIQSGKLKLRPMLSWFAFKRLTRNRPCMFIRGELSDLFDEKIVSKMARRAPRLQLLEIPGVGHAPTLNEPQAIAGIQSFLESVR